MEKKDAVKISLSTFFLILAIVVIVIMAYFIYKLNNDKQLANNKVTELNNQVGGLESTVNDLKGTISDISNTISKSNSSNETKSNKGTQTNSNSNTPTNASVTKSFSNDEIKNAIQNYLDLVGASEGSPEGLLVKLGLTSFGENTENADNNYIKTNIKYSEYKAKMLNYMTEKWFENNFTKFFKNVNGYLYYANVGATGMEYEVKSITIKGDYSDSSYIANVDNIYLDDSREQENIEFHIENYNGKCVISYCD